MNAEPCTKAGDEEGTKRIEVYVGGTDEDREGTKDRMGAERSERTKMTE